jgi:hypothetical protein
MRDKKKTKNIKVRDMQPKKDAKGGVVGTQNHQTQSHGTQSHGIQNHGIQNINRGT